MERKRSPRGLEEWRKGAGDGWSGLGSQGRSRCLLCSGGAGGRGSTVELRGKINQDLARKEVKARVISS